MVHQSLTIKEFEIFDTHASIIGTCIVCWIIQSVNSTLLNTNTKSFHGKKLTLVTTLEDVNDIVEASDHVLSVVVLPPEAGDNQSLETDEGDINNNLDDASELAGQLELEEETDGESDNETTECRSRRLGSRLLKATQFDTQMRSTSFERNDDMMNLGEMSPHVVWKQYDVLHDLVSIDESMMPYYGSHSCKMFIKGKPIRFGYKLWCLCESDGYS